MKIESVKGLQIFDSRGMPTVEAEVRLRCGAVYDREPDVLKKQLKADNRRPNPIVSFLRRGLRFLKRRLMP